MKINAIYLGKGLSTQRHSEGVASVRNLKLDRSKIYRDFIDVKRRNCAIRSLQAVTMEITGTKNRQG